MRKLILVLASATFVFAIAGCGDDDGDTSSDAPTEPAETTETTAEAASGAISSCDDMPGAGDVSAVIGESTQLFEELFDDQVLCDFKTEDELATSILFRARLGEGTDFEPTPNDETVDGLGVDAYWSTVSEFLTVIVDGDLVEVTGGDATTREQLEQLGALFAG